jgi:hypothetical protein
MRPERDLKVKKETIIGAVKKSDTQEVQVSLIDSNIGEYISITDMYEKDGEMCKGKGKWIPVDMGDEIAALVQKAYDTWIGTPKGSKACSIIDLTKEA